MNNTNKGNWMMCGRYGILGVVFIACMFALWGWMTSGYGTAQGALDDPSELQPIHNKKPLVKELDVNGIKSIDINAPTPTSGEFITGRVLYESTPAPEKRVYARWESPLGISSHETHTDKDGCFQIPACIKGKCWIAVTDETLFGGISIDWPAQRDQMPFDIYLRNGGTLSGRVIDERRHSVEGAQVDASVFLDVGRVAPVLTDAQGYFSTAFPWADEYRFDAVGLHVTARKGDKVGVFTLSKNDQRWKDIVRELKPLTNESHQMVGAPKVGGIVIVLVPSCSIGGYVVDPSGSPLGDVEIFVQSKEQTGNTCTLADSEGRFHIEGLSSGHYALAVSREGHGNPIIYYTLVSSVSLSTGSSREDLKLVVPLASTLCGGRVVDAEGSPIEGASVSLDYLSREDLGAPDGYGMYTDEQGRFYLPHLYPGEYKMEVSHKFHLRYCSYFTLTNPENDLLIEMPKSPVVHGRITDESLQNYPAGASLEVFAGENPLPTTYSMTIEESTVDSDGQFSIVLPGTGLFTIQATAENYVSVPQTISVAADETIEGVILILDISTPIFGTLSDDRGNPVPSTTLQFERPDVVGYATAFTDEEGHFIINGLKQGAYQVKLSDYEIMLHTIPCEVIPGQQIHLTLPQPGSICGTVRKGGLLPEGWQVCLSYHDKSDENFSISRTMEIVNGQFTLEDIPEGQYELLIKSAGTGQEISNVYSRTVTISSGRVTSISVELPNQTATVSGTVYVDGEPRKDVDVHLFQNPTQFGGNYLGLAKTNDDGQYVVHDVPSGKSTLCASLEQTHGDERPTYCTKQIKMDIQEGEKAKQDVCLTTNAVLVVQVDNVQDTEWLSVLLLSQGMDWEQICKIQGMNEMYFRVLNIQIAGPGQRYVRMQNLCPGQYTVVAVVTPNPVVYGFCWNSEMPKRIVEIPVVIPETATRESPIELRLIASKYVE